MTEEWRIIPSFPTYEASSIGRIKSAYRTLKPGVDEKGYFVVTVYKGGAAFRRRVHVLVCEAFHGPKPAWAAVAAHRNGRKSNNRPGNLRWSTYQGNSDDQIGHGTRRYGERHPQATMTTSQVKTIRVQHAAEPGAATIKRLADAFMVTDHTIRDIVTGRTWQKPKPKCKRRATA